MEQTNEPQKNIPIPRINYTFIMPMVLLFATNGIYNLTIKDWSEAVVSTLLILATLMYTQLELKVAERHLIPHQLGVSLIKALEKIQKKEIENSKLIKELNEFKDICFDEEGQIDCEGKKSNDGDWVMWEDVKKLQVGFCDNCNKNVVAELYNELNGTLVCLSCGQFVESS